MKKLKPGKDNKEERMNFVEYWAEYVRENADELWSKEQNIVINSQFKSSRDFVKRLLKEKNGIERIMEIYNIKNKKGYENLLKIKK